MDLLSSNADDANDKGYYQRALPQLLRRRQQWLRPHWQGSGEDLRGVQAICPGDVAAGPGDEIIVGNEKGEIIALDSANQKIVWSYSANRAVKTLQSGVKLQSGTMLVDTYDTILFSSGDEYVYTLVIDRNGKLLEKKSPVFPDEQISCLFIRKENGQPLAPIHEVYIGTEQQHIYIYGADLSTETATINVPGAITALLAYDITTDTVPEVLVGTRSGQVYVYQRRGQATEEIWSYATNGSVNALAACDIDEDGSVEIIIGSSDGWLYVVNAHGFLKWCYSTGSPVLSVAVLDVNNDGKYALLVGCDDGVLYMLNADGDECKRWQTGTGQPLWDIRVVSMNRDEKTVEIALRVGEGLELLQVVDPQQDQEELQHYIDKFQSSSNAYNLCLELAQDTDAYVRGFACAMLTNDHPYTPTTIQLLTTALADTSIEVGRSVISGIFHRLDTMKKDAGEPLRQLEQLVLTSVNSSIQESVQELCLLLTQQLYRLAPVNTKLCFDIIKRLAIEEKDRWVRRAAIRQLDKLLVAHPTEALYILYKTVVSEDEWICFESSRVLAHYFDLLQRDELTDEIYDLLDISVKPQVMRIIAANSIKAFIRDFFTLLAILLEHQPDMSNVSTLSAPSEKDLRAYLHATLPEAQSRELAREDRALALYAHFSTMLRIRDLFDFNPHISAAANAYSDETFFSAAMVRIVRQLYTRLEHLGSKKRADTSISHEYATELNSTIILLDEIERLLRAESIRAYKMEEISEKALVPENMLLILLVQRWYNIVKRELRGVEGRANIIYAFRSVPVRVQEGRQYSVSIRISNKGTSAANNVRVVLEPDDDRFELIDSNEQDLGTIDMGSDQVAHFTVNVGSQSDELRLPFMIIYDDMSALDSKIFSNNIICSSPFREMIDNPYISNAPISDNKMFFGRTEYMDLLHKKISEPDTENVVLLYGMRNAGKTTIMYQLCNETQPLEKYLPLLLNLVVLFPKGCTAQDMLKNLVMEMQGLLKESGRYLDLATQELPKFEPDPFLPLERFLCQLVAELDGKRLLLLIDEFDSLATHLADGTITTQFIDRLVATIGHIEGVSLLLAGGSQIYRNHESRWSVLSVTDCIYRISRLESDEADMLITRPIKGYFSYDERVIPTIHRLTDDQPFFIQLLCETIVQLCNKRQITCIDDTIVNSAVDSILKKETSYFTWIWKYIGQKERLLLSAIAWEQRVDGQRRVALNDIVSLYETHSDERRSLRVDLSSVVKSLEEQNYITTFRDTNDVLRMKISADLLRQWLRRTRPFNKVIRERYTNYLGDR